jgi:hypothetical protein
MSVESFPAVAHRIINFVLKLNFKDKRTQALLERCNFEEKQVEMIEMQTSQIYHSASTGKERIPENNSSAPALAFAPACIALPVHALTQL